MLRRDILRTAATGGVVGLAGCARQSGRAAFRDEFEDGMGEWTAGSAIGPEVDLDGDTYVAVGTSVIWEGDATHYVDEVSVNLDPQ